MARKLRSMLRLFVLLLKITAESDLLKSLSGWKLSSSLLLVLLFKEEEPPPVFSLSSSLVKFMAGSDWLKDVGLVPGGGKGDCQQIVSIS